MKVNTSHEPLSRVPADVLVVMMPEGAEVKALEGAGGELVPQALAAGDFTGESGQTALFYAPAGLAARKLMLWGLGKAGKLDLRKLARAAGMAAREARKSGARRLAIAVPLLAGFDPGRAARFVTEGALHGLYRFTTFKTEPKPEPVTEELVIVSPPGTEADVAFAEAVASGVNYARGLNWLPGNHLTAAKLAEAAQELCQEAGIEIEVYDRQGCRDLGLGLLLAVNQGSVEEPRFIVMRYKGAGGKGPWLGLVGKGITFDSGGISIKPTENMWDMKYDMSGAGAVLGALKCISRVKPACDILAIVCATDNMPDGGAYKPGDVISGLSGKTVEIRSTDAEGRLVLSDGLAYAAKQGCSRLITASTLTGAANIALGPIRFGIVANNDDWEAKVFAAAEAAGERGWRLPHDEEYNELFKSPVADMSNTGTGRSAGTVVGGLFLMKHVGGTPCVHLDIAAQAWRGGEDRYEDAGATGVAVRTFVQAALEFAGGNA